LYKPESSHLAAEGKDGQAESIPAGRQKHQEPVGQRVNFEDDDVDVLDARLNQKQQ